MQNRNHAKASAALVLLSALMPTAACADLAQVDVTTLDTALERARHEMAVKQEKMARHLLPAMRRNEIDMWIILSREFNVDPLLDLFGGHGIDGWYGHRNAYVFRDPGGDGPLESVIIGTHQSGHMLRFFRSHRELR